MDDVSQNEQTPLPSAAPPPPAPLEYQSQAVVRGERLKRTTNTLRGVVACLGLVFCAYVGMLVTICFEEERPWDDIGRMLELSVGFVMSAGGVLLCALTALQFLFGLPSLRDLIRRRR